MSEFDWTWSAASGVGYGLGARSFMAGLLMAAFTAATLWLFNRIGDFIRARKETQ